MTAEFKMGRLGPEPEPGTRGEDPIELIVLTGGLLGQDTVKRAATADDRHLYAAEYAAFKTALGQG